MFAVLVALGMGCLVGAFFANTEASRFAGTLAIEQLNALTSSTDPTMIFIAAAVTLLVIMIGTMLIAQFSVRMNFSAIDWAIADSF